MKSNSRSIDDAALALIRRLPTSRRSLWTAKAVRHSIVIQFQEFPKLLLYEKIGEESLPAWPDPLPYFALDKAMTHLGDHEIINLAFDHANYPLGQDQMNWQSVTCQFKLSGKEILEPRIYKSSGLPSIDDAAIKAVKSEFPPFEPMQVALQHEQEIRITFFSKGEIRVKLKSESTGEFLPIGRSGQYPDPI